VEATDVKAGDHNAILKDINNTFIAVDLADGTEQWAHTPRESYSLQNFVVTDGLVMLYFYDRIEFLDEDQ